FAMPSTPRWRPVAACASAGLPTHRAWISLSRTMVLGFPIPPTSSSPFSPPSREAPELDWYSAGRWRKPTAAISLWPTAPTPAAAEPTCIYRLRTAKPGRSSARSCWTEGVQGPIIFMVVVLPWSGISHHKSGGYVVLVGWAGSWQDSSLQRRAGSEDRACFGHALRDGAHSKPVRCAFEHSPHPATSGGRSASRPAPLLSLADSMFHSQIRVANHSLRFDGQGNSNALDAGSE